MIPHGLRLLPSFVALFFLLIPATSPAVDEDPAKSPSNVLSGVEVQERDGFTRVEIRAASKPAYTLFKMRSPDRLVVDLLQTETREPLSPQIVNSPHVVNVSSTQFKQGGHAVSRVVIGLKEGVLFSAAAEDNSVLVSLSRKPKDEGAGEPKKTASAPASLAPAALSAPALAALPGEPRVVESHGDREHPAPLSVRRIQAGPDDSVTILTDRGLTDYEVLEAYAPFRIVVDLFGATLSGKKQTRELSGQHADRMRAVQFGGKTRVVLDCARGKSQMYALQRLPEGLKIQFRAQNQDDQRTGARALEPLPSAKPSAAPLQPSAALSKMATARAPLVRFEPRPSAAVKPAPKEKAAARPNRLVEPPSIPYSYAPDQVAAENIKQPDIQVEKGAGVEKEAKYTGKRISLDFKDADIHNILRLISEVAKLNIITSDSVKGTVTVTMRNVPWDQALDIILKTKSLGMMRHGNIIRVAPITELAQERELAQKLMVAQTGGAPLHLRLIPVNFAPADSLKDQVKDVLSERGSVSVNARTNVLIIKDILENVIKAEALVRSLDTETPQVLIEARIVEANTQFVREIGIQWGGDLAFSSATGNPTGLPFPSNVVITGGADDGAAPSQGTGTPGHFAINMPAPAGAGAGGSVGFIFGSAGGIAKLNLRLSAMENTGTVKIVSAPRVTTLDNVAARIGQGVSIPISVVSAAGVNTQFVEAKVELEVTPHITQEGSVLLKLSVRKNEPDFSRTGARGDPTLLKKEAETQVLVRDGDTTVIGGIYTRKTSSTMAGVPFLSKIPILGWFFRNNKNADERTELLIFVTPRIVNRLRSTVATQAAGPQG